MNLAPQTLPFDQALRGKRDARMCRLSMSRLFVLERDLD